MTAALSPVPAPRGAIPYLIIRGAADAIGFYQRVFGAELVGRLNAPDGSVIHAELHIGPSHFMLSEECPQHQALSPTTLGGSATTAIVYVPDADTVVRRAIDAGAQVTMPLADQFWGDRAGGVADPFGHRWIIATRREEPSWAELQQRASAMAAQMSR